MICIKSTRRGAESKMILFPKRAFGEYDTENLGLKRTMYHDNACSLRFRPLVFLLHYHDLQASIKPLQGSTESCKWIP